MLDNIQVAIWHEKHSCSNHIDLVIMAVCSLIPSHAILLQVLVESSPIVLVQMECESNLLGLKLNATNTWLIDIAQSTIFKIDFRFPRCCMPGYLSLRLEAVLDVVLFSGFEDYLDHDLIINLSSDVQLSVSRVNLADVITDE